MFWPSVVSLFQYIFSDVKVRFCLSLGCEVTLLGTYNNYPLPITHFNGWLCIKNVGTFHYIVFTSQVVKFRNYSKYFETITVLLPRRIEYAKTKSS